MGPRIALTGSCNHRNMLIIMTVMNMTLTIMTTSTDLAMDAGMPRRGMPKLDVPTKVKRDAKAPPDRYLPELFQLAPGGIPIRRAPAALARRFQQICVAMIAEALVGEDVVQLEYAVLQFLDDVPGIDQRRLAEALGIDRNNTGVLVDGLEKKGLLDRRVNGEDRRARQLSVTAKGRKVLDRVRPKSRVTSERILKPLARAEQDQFIEFMVRLIEGNRSYARPGAGRRKRGPVQQEPSK
jgi:DNA-binding MarR family transcriptional regulator